MLEEKLTQAIRDFSKGMLYKVAIGRDTLFVGNIKNKSELKRLLIQLNIIS